MRLAGLERIVKIIHASQVRRGDSYDDGASAAVMSTARSAGSERKASAKSTSGRREKKGKRNEKGKI